MPCSKEWRVCSLRMKPVSGQRWTGSAPSAIISKVKRAKLATERAQAARPVINPDDLSGPDGTLPRLLRMYEERVIDTDVWGLGPMVEELP